MSKKNENLPYYTLNHISKLSFVTKSNSSGSLSIFEQEKEILYPIKRAFTVRSSKDSTHRGRHAHKLCRQSLFCIEGSCLVFCDDGKKKEEYLITPSTYGLYIPPSIWAEQYYKKTGTTLLVFCDLIYDENDYIRDYKAFRDHRSQIENLSI